MNVSLEEVKNTIQDTITYLRLLEKPITKEMMSKELIDKKRKEATDNLKSLLMLRDILSTS
jgi:hypothetical protein